MRTDYLPIEYCPMCKAKISENYDHNILCGDIGADHVLILTKSYIYMRNTLNIQAYLYFKENKIEIIQLEKNSDHYTNMIFNYLTPPTFETIINKMNLMSVFQ